jgi:hypothetical protein
MVDGLGWVATALFGGSYFCKTSRAMRRLQASAALLWIGYGIWMSAPPIIVANVIVASLALYSDWKQPHLSSADNRQPEAEPLTEELIETSGYDPS